MKEKLENPFVNAYGFGTDVYERSQEGITLRDYYAGLSMQKPVSYKPINFYNWLRWFFGYNFKACSRPHNENAIQAYELADAMLKQRLNEN